MSGEGRERTKLSQRSIKRGFCTDSQNAFSLLQQSGDISGGARGDGQFLQRKDVQIERTKCSIEHNIGAILAQDHSEGSRLRLKKRELGHAGTKKEKCGGGTQGGC